MGGSSKNCRNKKSRSKGGAHLAAPAADASDASTGISDVGQFLLLAAMTAKCLDDLALALALTMALTLALSLTLALVLTLALALALALTLALTLALAHAAHDARGRGEYRF